MTFSYKKGRFRKISLRNLKRGIGVTLTFINFNKTLRRRRSTLTNRILKIRRMKLLATIYNFHLFLILRKKLYLLLHFLRLKKKKNQTKIHPDIKHQGKKRKKRKKRIRIIKWHLQNLRLSYLSMKCLNNRKFS